MERITIRHWKWRPVLIITFLSIKHPTARAKESLPQIARKTMAERIMGSEEAAGCTRHRDL